MLWREGVNLIGISKCSTIEEPTIKRVFDGIQDTSDSLDYELRLFPAIDRLCTLLNEIDYAND